jgi:hypothetical protein
MHNAIYIATVNRQGRYRLLQRTGRGSRLLREAMLDLEGLFEQPRRAVPALINRQWARDLPAIFCVAPFPLLLAHNVDPKRMWYVADEGVLTLTNDRRLTLWTSPRQGAQQLADDVPPGALWWTARDAREGTTRAVVGHMSPAGLHLLHIDLVRYQCVAKRLDIDRGVRSICAHNGALFAVYRDRVLILGEESGDVLQSLALPAGMERRHDRFFCDATESWYVMSYDGMAVRLEPVRRCPRLLALLERDGIDGPIGVRPNGDLYVTATGKLQRVRHELPELLEVRDIARNGRRFVLESSSAPAVGARYRAAVVDVDTLRVDHYHDFTPWLVEPALREMVQPKSQRHRFTHIQLDRHGRLGLTTRKLQCLSIDYHAATAQIQLVYNPSAGFPTRHGLTFKPVRLPPEVGFHLSRAVWSDGSEAFLDSRGLLHLRSSDRTVPETTIVLRDGEVAGWCSDGRLWGARYYIGTLLGASTKEVFESAISAFCHRLP